MTTVATPNSTVAALFLDLFNAHPERPLIIDARAERDILLNLVQQAGFSVTNIRPGFLNMYSDVTGENYDINRTLPYEFVGSDSKPHEDATGWMNQLCEALDGAAPNQLLKLVEREVERSTPLAPIILNDLGEQLIEMPPRSREEGYFVKHTRDTDPANGSMVGLHVGCGNYIKRLQVSSENSVLVCTNCCLRVHVSTRAKTYGDIRQELNHGT